MTFKEDILKARGHLVIISSIIVSLAIIPRLENYNKQAQATTNIEQNESLLKKSVIKLPESEVLSKQDIINANIAWKYFENNYNPQTGLVNSVDKYNASTMWDTSSYLLALICSYEIGIISKQKFDSMMSKALNSIYTMKLINNELPNKSYNTRTLDMVDYTNHKTNIGIGSSAIDIGRLFVPLYINIINYPKYSKISKDIIKRFKLNNVSKNGILYGSYFDASKNLKYVQEGRLGYEEYSAKSFNLVGFNANKALQYDDFLDFVNVYSIKLPVDTRDAKKFKAHNFVVSEPYILEGIEMGFDDISKEFAFRVYKAQEERFNNTGILTAVSEDNIDKKPYFVYNTVFSDGKIWNCITDKGVDSSQFKSLSTKAVFGWHTLYRNNYTNKMMDKIKNNFNPNRGWYSGIYEKNNDINKSITCNTNAIIIESLYYKKFGKIINLRIN